MGNAFFCADLHLGHWNIIKYCNRPFKSADEMDKTIIDNINAVVKEDDELWILGDFCFAPVNKAIDYRKMIKAKNIMLIRGNHDKQIHRPSFHFVADNAERSFDGLTLFMHHFPALSWNKAFHGVGHLFGHVHGRLNDFLAKNLPNAKMLDVGVDSHNFKPWSLDEIKSYMATKSGKDAF